MNCLIVDDNPMAQKALEILCNKLELNIVSTLNSGEDAIKYLESNPVDLLFLDIEMGGISGVELLDQLSFPPMVIFTTSKKEYAYKAFEHNAIDYLIKPVDMQALKKAVNKAQVLQDQKSSESNIFIRSDGKLIRLVKDDIQYIENVGNYVKLYVEGKSYMVYSTLKYVTDKLKSDKFIKVHRSFVVNLDKIRDIEDRSIVIGDQVIPVSKSNLSLLMSRLNLL
jgi:two-component system response regulator LytT